MAAACFSRMAALAPDPSPESIAQLKAFVAAGGVPCHANGALLRGVLRGELGLAGPIVSDCNDVGGLVAFRVAANRTVAAATAIVSIISCRGRICAVESGK